MNKMLTLAIALSFVLTGCGAAETDGELAPQPEGAQELASADESDEKDGDAAEADSDETAAEAGDTRADRVFNAHVPRLPE